MSGKRQSASGSARQLLELSAIGGAFAGAWLAAHGPPRRVHTVAEALAPYVSHTLAGAAVGLALGAAVLLGCVYVNRGRRRAAPAPRREALSERVRHEVWRRDQGRCVDCGSRARLEFDHIIPVSRGGSSTARNVELRCQACNRRKGARI